MGAKIVPDMKINNVKPYDQGVSDERDRVLKFLIDVGTSVELIMVMGKRRDRKRARIQSQILIGIYHFLMGEEDEKTN